MKNVLHQGLSVRQYSSDSENYEKNVNKVFLTTATKQSNMKNMKNDTQALLTAQLQTNQQPN